MPELPEVEITARRLASELNGAEVESALAPGLVTMKSFDPPLEALAGREVTGVGRRGKLPIVEFGDLALLIHLMSAGRIAVFDKRASLRDKASRLLVRLTDGRELRLREFGSKQRAWAKLLPTGEVEADEALAKLGPEAFPAPSAAELAERLSEARPLHPLLRDQKVIAGIGRTWVDDVLWEARLSPFKRGAELSPEEADELSAAMDAVLGGAIRHYEQTVEGQLPDKAPKPVRVHARQGEPCPRCGTELAAIHYSEHVNTYCPTCQTGGKVLKDRRLSRLLK